MRGRHDPQSTMRAFVNLEERVPPDHPLRIIKRVADDVLDHMSGDMFAVGILPLNAGDLDLLDSSGFPEFRIDSRTFAHVLDQLPSGSVVYLHTVPDDEEENAVIHRMMYYSGLPDLEGELPYIEADMVERLAEDGVIQEGFK